MVSMAHRAREVMARTLQAQRRAAADLRESAEALRRARAHADRACEEAAARLAPFQRSTTVHQAWARHPGVRRIFARYHLYACPDCSVGMDETLEEAAFGYEIELSGLLGELNGLLEG